MTKCAQWLCVLILQTILCFSLAFAESSSLYEIQHAEDFSLIKSMSSYGDEILLAGYIGESMNCTAALLCVNTNGETKWLIQGLDVTTNASRFRTAINLNEDEYITMRTLEGKLDESFFATVQNGKIIKQFQRPYYSYGIYPADQGFLDISMPNRNVVTISKFDYEYNLAWKKSIGEPLLISDVMMVNDGYIAIGTKDVYREYPVGVIMKLDKDGHVVWKHYTSEKVKSISGIVVSNNSIVFVANVLATMHEEPWGYSIIAQYDSNGPVWQTDYRYGDGKEGDMLSIMEDGDGFLIACQDSLQHSEIRLQLVDEKGNNVKEWVESIGDLYRGEVFRLHRISEAIYLVAGGTDSDEKRLTILKRISVPSI